MDQPTQLPPHRVSDDTFVLPGWLPLPGLGVIPMSSFLIRGAQPTLIDTGAAPMAAGMLADLEGLVDLEDLAWIWLTHTDPDHIGALQAVLERAPNARVVTTFLGVGKLSLQMAIAPERFYLMNPGGKLDIGDRTLVALRPPVFDAPETMSPFDTRSRNLFVADAFGTLMGAPTDRAEDLSDDALAEGMLTWASIDVPWLQVADATAFGSRLAELEQLEPARVLGSHLPPATDIDRLARTIERAVGLTPFVGPDQAAVEAQNVA